MREPWVTYASNFERGYNAAADGCPANHSQLTFASWMRTSYDEPARLLWNKACGAQTWELSTSNNFFVRFLSQRGMEDVDGTHLEQAQAVLNASTVIRRTLSR